MTSAVSAEALGVPHDGRPSLRAIPGGRGAALGSASDKDLLLWSQQGDRAAFGALVVRHQRVLTGLVRQRLGRHEPVEDIVQETFARALAHLGRFRGRSSFVTWAGSIAINLATDHQRKSARRRRLAPTTDIEADAVPSTGRSGADDVETRDEAERARRAIAALPLRLQLAVTMRVVEELPYAEISKRLEAPLPTVRKWVSRGLEQVRTALEVNDDQA